MPWNGYGRGVSWRQGHVHCFDRLAALSGWPIERLLPCLVFLTTFKVPNNISKHHQQIVCKDLCARIQGQIIPLLLQY
jgi:hypothetical protein